jgi:hypothetical protein
MFIALPSIMRLQSSRSRALRVLLVIAAAAAAAAATATTVMDASGSLRLGALPEISTVEGLIAVITSPGTPSVLSVDPPSIDASISLVVNDSESSDTKVLPTLVCRGAVLGTTSLADRMAMATCFTVAGAVVIDGITLGDVENGLQHGRHARTLTALFQARLAVQAETIQTLLLVVGGENDEENDNAADDDDEAMEQHLQRQVQALYDAVALEKKESPSFADRYKIQVIAATSSQDSSKVGGVGYI